MLETRSKRDIRLVVECGLEQKKKHEIFYCYVLIVERERASEREREREVDINATTMTELGGRDGLVNRGREEGREDGGKGRGGGGEKET